MGPADEADFTAFVAGSSRRLLRGAYLITGDLDEAQDLLQAALERAYRRWPSVRRCEVPEAYVRRILVNLATDRWRVRRVKTVALEEDLLPALEDRGVEGVPARSALLACVRQLPVRQRAVLVLRYFNDLTEAETARLLGCSVGTVKSHHARAMARLRELVPDRRSS
jgi:RNA polymerase sigma-70 factor (sigma-E family)